MNNRFTNAYRTPREQYVDINIRGRNSTDGGNRSRGATSQITYTGIKPQI
jgi:hypothetical protein